MSTLPELLKRKRELHDELNALVYRRSACKTEAERLKLIPEAVRITSEMRRVEEELEKQTGQKMKWPFD
jgi:hypothetical protein